MLGIPEDESSDESSWKGRFQSTLMSDPTQEGGFKKGIEQDIAFALTNPSAITAKMRVGLDQALAGIQRRRAEVLQQEYGKHAEDYVKPLLESSANLEQEAKDIQTGLDLTYKPKSKVGQFAADLTQSVPAALSGVAAAIVAGPWAGAAVGAGLGSGQVYGTKYLERRNMGDDPDSASTAASFHATAELIPQVLGATAFVKLFKAMKTTGGSITPALARYPARFGRFLQGSWCISGGLARSC
jgi:hypothetical protein